MQKRWSTWPVVVNPLTVLPDESSLELPLRRGEGKDCAAAAVYHADAADVNVGYGNEDDYDEALLFGMEPSSSAVSRSSSCCCSVRQMFTLHAAIDRLEQLAVNQDDRKKTATTCIVGK